MSGPGSIRGSKIGSAQSHEDVRGPLAERFQVSYFCANGHETTPSFSASADPKDLPEEWACPQCGLPAGRDAATPPEPPKNVPFKTHLDYVKERRSESECEALLDEALAALRRRRGG
ncbi:MAG: RNA polymerase-binding protein RbpA [Bowdeniella nasicola]|nr:RNA polymerase-binding protein RbpA [Bowdeniella nasicola]